MIVYNRSDRFVPIYLFMICYILDVRKLIAAFNEKICGDSVGAKQKLIRIWQHEKVCELIIKNLQFIERIQSVTNALGGGRVETKLLLVPIF